MIADQLIPSFYVIEVEGKAVESIIPGAFDIERISIGSRDFPNDMFATAALSNAMQLIALNPDLDKAIAEERIDYNPEFFPTLKPAALTIEQKDSVAAEEEAAQKIDLGPGEIAVPITHGFDPLGDFVESRWTIKSPDFRISGRVAVNPDRYMQYKVMDVAERSNSPKLKSETPSISLH